MKKKLFAILLTFAMVFTYMPALAFADTDAPAEPEEPVAAEAAETEEAAPEEVPEAAEEAAEQAAPAEEAVPAEEPAEAALEAAEGKEAKAALEDLEIATVDYTVGENGYTAYIGSSSIGGDLGHEGDSLTLHFVDGTSASYISRHVDAGEEFFLTETDRMDLEIDSVLDGYIGWEFADDNQTTFKEGDNAVYFFVKGVSTNNTINVVGIEKPEKITGITYTPAADAEYRASVNGTYPYNFPCIGDKLVIAFEKHSETYTYKETGTDEDGYTQENFVDGSGRMLTDDAGYEWEWRFKEGQNKFTAEDNTFEFAVYDVISWLEDEDASNPELETEYAFTALIEVQLEPATIKSAEFINKDPVEVSATAQKETDRQGTEWTYYYYDAPLAEGDEVRLVFDDNTTLVYTAAYTEEGGRWFFETDAVDPADEDSSAPAAIDFTYYDNQSSGNQWQPGNQYECVFNFDGGAEAIRPIILNVSECKHDNLEHFEAVEADCSNAGNAEYWYCPDCEKYFRDEDASEEIDYEDVVIPATGEHSLELIEGWDADCQDKGQEDYYICTECGKMFSDEAGTDEIDEPVVIDKTDHKWGEWHVETPATEEATGLKVRVCEVCGEREEEVIPVLDHTHVVRAVEAVAPTCEEDGTIAHYVCNKCGHLFADAEATQELTEAQIVDPATGHDWDEGNITTEPTCETEGVKTFTCKNDSSHTKTETVAALGHDFGEWTETTAPTCTEAGEETRECSRCDETETRPVAALGHDFGEWTETTAPTCTEDGVETRECSRCDEAETRPVEALGHEFGEWAETTAPTCTEAGVETRECTRCDEAETRPVEALGHDFGEWTETTAPTYSEDGVETKFCSRCDETETQSIPKLSEQMDEAAQHAADTAADAAQAAKAAEDAQKAAQEAAAKADAAAKAEPSAANVAAANAANANAKAAAKEAERLAAAAEAAATEAEEAANKAQEVADSIEADETAPETAKAAAKTAAATAKTKASEAKTSAQTAKNAAQGAAISAEAAQSAATKAAEAKAAADEAAKAPVISTSLNAGKKKVTVNWNAVSGASYYVVSYRQAGKGWKTKTTTKTSYTVKKLKSKGMYEFRVAAVKAGGSQSDWSASDYRYIYKRTPKLKRGKGYVKVKWSKDKKASGYQVYYSASKDMSNATVVTLNGKSKTSYKISGLAKGQRVYVKVRPFKNSGGKTYIGALSSRKTAKAK